MNGVFLILLFVPPILLWWYVFGKGDEHVIRTNGGRYTSYPDSCLLWFLVVFVAPAAWFWLIDLIYNSLS